MLNALVYQSHTNDALSEAELEVILVGSRVRNARRGLTGVLIKRDGTIVQYLEGPPDMLERTFEAIAASPLHRDVHVLARAENVERVFDRWHMGFCELQSRVERSDATSEWVDARPDARAAERNPAIARLLERWDAMMGDAPAG